MCVYEQRIDYREYIENVKPKQFIYKVGCKININLKVGNLLSNGYHELETLMYPITNPFDTLVIIEEEIGKDFFVECRYEELSNNNILYQVYSLVRQHCSNMHFFLPFSYTVILEKGIPIGGGLGGGSADAGCFLLYFLYRFPSLFSFSIIEDIGKQLGADIPFFLQNTPKPMYAKGIGNILEETSFSLSGNYCLVVEFSHKINTAEAYKKLDIFKESYKKNLTNKNQYSRKYEGLTVMNNDFEEMLFEEFPVMRDCKTLFLLNGAIIAGVSGSGSSMFGIFRTEEECAEAELSVQNIALNIYYSDL